MQIPCMLSNQYPLGCIGMQLALCNISRAMSFTAKTIDYSLTMTARSLTNCALHDWRYQQNPLLFGGLHNSNERRPLHILEENGQGVTLKQGGYLLYGLNLVSNRPALNCLLNLLSSLQNRRMSPMANLTIASLSKPRPNAQAFLSFQPFLSRICCWTTLYGTQYELSKDAGFSTKSGKMRMYSLVVSSHSAHVENVAMWTTELWRTVEIQLENGDALTKPSRVKAKCKSNSSPTSQYFKPFIIEKDLQLVRRDCEGKISIHPAALQAENQFEANLHQSQDQSTFSLGTSALRYLPYWDSKWSARTDSWDSVAHRETPSCQKNYDRFARMLLCTKSS